MIYTREAFSWKEKIEKEILKTKQIRKDKHNSLKVKSIDIKQNCNILLQFYFITNCLYFQITYQTSMRDL
jgi:hypothetical protein